MATGTVDHYMPMFGRDFLASTAGWTAAERGHYFVLLIVQWEQGAIPDGLDRLELVSPGVTAAWAILEPKFPAGDDGLRRNRRLEEHRVKARELKDARSEAGKRGNDARWNRNGIANGSQTDRKAIANGVASGSRDESHSGGGRDSGAIGTHPNRHASEDGQSGSQNDRKPIANGIAKTSPPTPTPNREERQYARAAGTADKTPTGAEPEPAGHSSDSHNTAGRPKPARGDTGAAAGANGHHGAAGDEWRRPGWVHDEWARVAAAWNATERAVPWSLATPPNGFADLAASPGWVEQAIAAMAMLPECRRFDRPVPWTQFVRDLDRILAGEFRDPREAPRQLAAAGGRQQKRGNL
jgi:uncharacterized protein YdaU (DUF1376 family)